MKGGHPGPLQAPVNEQQDDQELERLERELTAVSGQLAARLDWEHVSAGMRRQLRRPYWDLALWAAVVSLMGLWGLQDSWAAWVALGLAVLVLPGHVAAVRERNQRLARNDRELFADCAEEIRRRFTSQVLLLIFGVPTAIALVVLAFVITNWVWPVALAALIVLYLPLHLHFRMRGTARELVESERWQRPKKGRAANSDEEDEDDDEDDEDSLRLTLSLALKSFWIFVLYLGPPLFLVLLSVCLAVTFLTV